jgi:iron complex transport system ATP-binding protein
VILAARDLSVRYPGVARRVLDSVSLSVEPGRLVAITGPNGSGKTTLVNALLGLAALDGGSAVLDGKPVGGWRRGSLARVVGVVAQREEVVFPITVWQTVMLGRYAHLGPLAPIGFHDREATIRALRRCDIEPLAERRVDTLSGGEWQRVRLARALAQQPRILVLDEPTASLDVRHEMELFELIRTLVADGLAGLVVTHELNLAARFADRIVLLNEGKVVVDGAPAEVLRQEIVTEVFGWPVAVTAWLDGSPQVVPLRPGEAARAAHSSLAGGPPPA